MFKTTQQKIDKLKIKIAGLEERIALKEKLVGQNVAYHVYASYINDKEKLAEHKECLRQLEIRLIEETRAKTSGAGYSTKGLG